MKNTQAFSERAFVTVETSAKTWTYIWDLNIIVSVLVPAYIYMIFCFNILIDISIQFRFACDTSYIVSVHIQCQASIHTLSLCRGHSWRVRLAKQETLTPPGHLVSPLVCRSPWMSTVVLYFWCHSDSASVLLYFTFLSHLFPLPCGAGSTVPREGFDSSVIKPFPYVLWLWHFLYSVGPHPVSSLHIYTFVVSRAFMACAASQGRDADSSRAPGLTSGLQRSVNVHRGALLLVPQWQCISSFVFYIYMLQLFCLGFLVLLFYALCFDIFSQLWLWLFVR